MLRIKKDVDLKELERFGFKKYRHGYYKKDLDEIEIFVDIEQRIIERAYLFHFTPINNDEIQDLIQAGLVEKVSEGENE